MLLESWVQSLSLLSPKSLKLFMLVTLKGVLDICTNKKMWSWLFLPLLVVYGPLVPLITVAISLCLFLLFLMARPSVRLKNMSYLRSYLFRYSSLVIIASVALLVAAQIYNTPLLRYCVYLVGPLAPLTVFAILFLLDSKNSVKNCFTSVYKSAKLVLYNLPIMVLFYGLWIAVWVPFFGFIIDFIMTIFNKGMLDFSFGKRLLFLIINRLWYLGAWYVFVVLITLPIVLMTNYYVKRVHDNFSLYE